MQLPETGFLRLYQILGDVKKDVPPLIPVKKSCWWEGVRSGRFPKPIRLSSRCTVWSVESIRAFIEQAKREGSI